MKLRARFVIVSFLAAAVVSTLAQTTSPNTSLAPTQVPRIINLSGVAKDESGKPMTGVVGITFSLYKDQQGGSPLWVETQNVQADMAGHYAAMLGAASSGGVPMSFFSSAEVHWISTQISGEPEQPRVMLLSVPYALKAVDAETLGGLPASAFVHANPSTAVGTLGQQPPSLTANGQPVTTVTGSGKKNFVPIWTGTTTLGDSVLFQSGINVGLGTTKPQAKFESVGSATAVLGTSTGNPGTGVAGLAAEGFGVSGLSNGNINGSTGVYGQASSTSGAVYGVQGSSASGGGAGVQGTNSSNSGGNGVAGFSNATSGFANGVYGVSASTGGNGVYGSATATSGYTAGVNGQSASTTGSGVLGQANATSGFTNGVSGQSASTGGNGVFGSATATSGFANGLSGQTASFLKETGFTERIRQAAQRAPE
jgi:hypothetical protein